MPSERLQKIISAAGITSRRNAEKMISGGLVSVNGQIVTELGSKADIDVDHIRVNGKLLHGAERHVYLLMNKPKGYVTTMSDPERRPTVMDLLHGIRVRVYPVGRLDYASEGLLLLTNDGDLAHRLTHPSYGVPKTYMAEIPGPVPRDLGRRLRAGVELEDGPAKVDSFEVVDVHNGRAVVEIVLHEGRKHIVRRMLDAVEHPVSRLVRTKIGDVQLGHQRPGTLRKLNPVEIAQLYKAVGL
jgi:23S rRNA pseudouridine2605 synthase